MPAIRARAAVVPDWLAEVVRPKSAPVPWPAMLRAALAICVPLSVALAEGRASLGVLPATGGILGTMVDTGGPYLIRLRRVSRAAVFGGAPGLAIGAAVHGHGWLAVVALVVVAGVSGLLSALGDIGSLTGLQLLVYSSLGLGPIGALRPVWHTAGGFLLGVLWALILIVPGWLLSPFGKEQRDVAAVYQAVANKLRAIGTGDLAARRQAATAALNTAYDELLTARSTAIGRNRRTMRLMAVLNASHPMIEASTTLGMAGTRPPPFVINTVERLADAIRDDTTPPPIPPPWSSSPGAVALRDAMVGLARVLARDFSSENRAWEQLGDRLRGLGPVARARAGLDRLTEAVGGPFFRRFTLRLMVCMGVAGVVSEVLPLQRSYWVPLTVAIVLKPDFGSVFARALQRAIGTVVGAVVGAVLLILIHGTWLLIPFAVLAALLPYGRSRNYGLLSTFLTPLVVVLIDLLSPGGWRLAEDRLVDTLVGCAIVLLFGYAPWPMSWYAHLPQKFAEAATDVRRYLEEALLGEDVASGDSSLPRRSRMRRATYRALADLRAEFQRTMSEPPAISRRASAWWPTVVALEQVMDAVTAVGQVAPVPESGVRQLSAALRVVSEAAASGRPVAAPPSLPEDETLKPVTEAVRALLGVLRPAQLEAGPEGLSRPSGPALRGSLGGPGPAEAGVAAAGSGCDSLCLELGEVVVGDEVDRGYRGRVADALQHGVDGAARLHVVGEVRQLALAVRAAGGADAPGVAAEQAVEPGAVQAEDLPLVVLGEFRIPVPVRDLVRDLEPPQRLDLPLRTAVPQRVRAEHDVVGAHVVHELADHVGPDRGELGLRLGDPGGLGRTNGRSTGRRAGREVWPDGAGRDVRPDGAGRVGPPQGASGRGAA